MRIWVCIDVTKPLLRRKRLNIRFPTTIWVRFAYKRLQIYVFLVGFFGHRHKDCPKWEELKQQCEMKGFPYENWIRTTQKSGATMNR